MTSKLVPAARARWQARIGLVIALGGYGALTVTASRHWRGDGLTAGWLTFGATVIIMLLPFLASGGRVRLHDRRYLTAWTISGPRTVDLHQLAKVDRFRALSKGPPVDQLVLVDVNGVRLMVDEPEVDRATKLALSKRATGVSVSRSAEDRLGLADPPDELRIRWFLSRLAHTLSIFPLWLGTLYLAQHLAVLV